MNKKNDSVTERAVVVTTEHRGVFFGYLLPEDNQAPEKVTLRGCRICVSWANSVHGVLGLAARGPCRESRVSPAAPSGEVWKITGVWDCTREAVAAWESEPWND